MTTTPADQSALSFRHDPRPYVERARERLQAMTDVELISWGKEAARLAKTNPSSVIARDEARAEWRRRRCDPDEELVCSSTRPCFLIT